MAKDAATLSELVACHWNMSGSKAEEYVEALAAAKRYLRTFTDLAWRPFEPST